MLVLLALLLAAMLARSAVSTVVPPYVLALLYPLCSLPTACSSKCLKEGNLTNL
jgi:hypothetical protein